MQRRSWSLLRILAIYVGVILAIPLVVRLPYINNFVHFYLQPLGTLKQAFITFSGASIGSFIAIMGAVWIQDRNKKAQDESEVKKSALIIYYDFLLAFKDLLPFYNQWWYLGHSEIEVNITYTDMMKMLNESCSNLYLVNDWIKIVANLRNDNNGAFIEEVYRTYEDLYNMHEVLAGHITDDDTVRKIIYSCERHYSQTLPLQNGAKWKIEVAPQTLLQLKQIAEIEDYDPVPIRNTKGWRIKVDNIEK